jgi:hypothetical protein
MQYHLAVNYTATYFDLYNYDTSKSESHINDLVTNRTSPYNIQNQVVVDEPARVVRLEVSVSYYAEIKNTFEVYNSTFIDQFTAFEPVQEIWASSEIHNPGFNGLYDSLIKPLYKTGWAALSRNAFAFKLWHKSVISGCGDACMRCNESFYDLNSEKLSAKC